MKDPTLKDPILPDFRTELAKEQTIMSSERTFLAWIRTGLAIVGGGVVVIRFVVFQEPLEHMLILASGKILILWGIVIFLLSLFDFRRMYKNKNATMPFSTNLFITLLVTSLISISLILFIFV